MLLEDSSDSGKDSLTVKQFVRVSLTEDCGELNPVFDKVISAHCDTAGKKCDCMCKL